MNQIDALNWIQSSIGKKFDTDGKHGLQCKDYANAYSAYLGHELKPSNAADTWSISQDPFWQKIEPSKTTIPQPGDIVIWKSWKDNPYGHIAVILDAEAEKFRSVDQNWINSNNESGSPAAIVTHSYTSPEIHGYLRPAFNASSTQNMTVEQRTQAVIDLNNEMSKLPLIIDHLSEDQKKNLASDLKRRKSELGLF